MAFLTWLWNLLRQGLGLALPLFSRERDFRGLGPGLRWALHTLLVAAILVGLYLVNSYAGLPQVLGRAPPALRDFWLPALFLLLYALSWLARWLIVPQPKQEVSEFPEIDRAWDEAVAALRQEGIDLADLPLFLVLGRPAKGESALFRSYRLPPAVANVPDRPDAPLHVHAYRDPVEGGIFVTCADASLLGRQAVMFAENARRGDRDEPEPDIPPWGRTFSRADFIRELGRPGRLDEIPAVHRGADDEAHDPGEREKGRRARPAPSEARRETLHGSRAEIDHYTARLKHLCSLIVRDRRPFCPVNGILVLLTLAATEREDLANQVATLCQHDLAAARQALQVHCPVFGLLCDLETVPGFVKFLERFPKEQRQRRLGHRFPFVPDLAPEDVADEVGGLMHWVCNDMFADWVYDLFRVETRERPDAAEAVRGNVGLYHLLRRMHQADRPLARLVTKGLAVPHNGLIMLGGCYIAGTGSEPAERGFIGGVLQRLIDCQEYVSWTDEGFAEEADYERWTQRGYIALVVLAAAAVVLIAYLISTMNTPS
jgi:hypothetical protein